MELVLNTKASRRKVSALNNFKKHVKLCGGDTQQIYNILNEEPEPESFKQNEDHKEETTQYYNIQEEQETENI